MGAFSKIILLFMPLMLFAAEVSEDTGNRVKGIVDTILTIFKGIVGSDGVSLYVKAGLMAFITIGGVIGSIWWKIYKRKLRLKKAEENYKDDQQDDIVDNQNENDTTENDARDLRDRIRDVKDNT